MINKKGYLTRHWVIAAVLFSVIISLYIIQMQAVAISYNDEDLLNEDFARHYDKLTNITSGVETIKDTTVSGEGLSFRGLFDVTFGAAFTAVQLVFSSLSLFGSMSVDVIADFTFLDRTVVGIFFTSVLTIITISLVWVWLSSIARGKF